MEFPSLKYFNQYIVFFTNLTCLLYRYVVFIVFATEHFLIILAFLLEWFISTTPKKVYIGIAKQEHWASKKEHIK